MSHIGSGWGGGRGGSRADPVAYQSYLPALVGREQLMEGNGRLEASRSAAYTAGPGVAGYLVQVLTAPVAILADAASYLWSAAWIAAIRQPEPPAPAPERPRAMGREIGEGLGLVLGHPLLRVLTLYNAVTVLFLSIERAMVVVFLVRTVGLPAGGIGLLYSVASAGTGGALGTAIGLRPTLGLSAAGCLLPALWLLRSPLARFREPVAPAREPGKTSAVVPSRPDQ